MSTNPTPSRPTPFTDSVSFLARAQYTNGQYEECVTAKDARTLESQRDEARELLANCADALEMLFVQQGGIGYPSITLTSVRALLNPKK